MAAWLEHYIAFLGVAYTTLRTIFSHGSHLYHIAGMYIHACINPHRVVADGGYGVLVPESKWW